MQVQYSLIDARPERALVAGGAGQRHLDLVLWHGGGRVPWRPLAGRAGAAAPARKPLADQIQADHRRFRRLGSVPGPAAHPATASPTGMAPTSPPSPAPPCWTAPAWPPSSSGRATAAIWRRTWRYRTLRLTDNRPRRDRRRAGAGPCARRRHLYAGARPHGRHGSIMKYNLNKAHPETGQPAGLPEPERSTTPRADPNNNSEDIRMKEHPCIASRRCAFARAATLRPATSPSGLVLELTGRGRGIRPGRGQSRSRWPSAT